MSFNKSFGTALGGSFGCLLAVGVAVFWTVFSCAGTFWYCSACVNWDYRRAVWDRTDETVKKCLAAEQAAQAHAAQVEAAARQRAAAAEADSRQQVAEAKGRADQAVKDGREAAKQADTLATRAADQRRDAEAARDAANAQAAAAVKAAKDADERREIAQSRLAAVLKEREDVDKMADENVRYARKLLDAGKTAEAAQRLWLVVDQYPGTKGAKDARTLLKTLTQ